MGTKNQKENIQKSKRNMLYKKSRRNRKYLILDEFIKLLKYQRTYDMNSMLIRIQLAPVKVLR
jgi:uncharacterized protein YggL (DUF469 family)